jgi:TPR repeat protein
MRPVVGRTAALHIAFWQYDPWYRRAWFVWPQAAAMLLASWLLADRGALPVDNWAKPADCSNPSASGCAATRRAVYYWDEVLSRPSLANQAAVSVDRSAFRSSPAADQPKLAAALGAYYRRDWAKAVDILKSAASTDPNVQFVTALALLTANTTDHARNAQELLRSAAAAGHRQAGGVLGRILVIGAGGLPRDEAAGRKLLDNAAAAGDTYAMRLLAAGYVSGEFGGTYDAARAVDLLRRAADGGEPVAMAQLAYSIHTGRAGLARDDARVVDWLRRSAELGFTEAQFTLGRLLTQRYFSRESEDVSEGIKWFERSYRQGHSVAALAELAVTRRFARAMPWFDTKAAFELLQLCAPFRYAYCQFWIARAYHDGAGAPQDFVKAYAHYTVAKDLGRQDAAGLLSRLDSVLQPPAKTRAAELAKSISADLKPPPRVVWLQTPETETAGPSPWADPATRAAAPSSPSAAPSSPDAAPSPSSVGHPSQDK